MRGFTLLISPMRPYFSVLSSLDQTLFQRPELRHLLVKGLVTSRLFLVLPSGKGSKVVQVVPERSDADPACYLIDHSLSG